LQAPQALEPDNPADSDDRTRQKQGEFEAAQK
jgi:hypothetical protein